MTARRLALAWSAGATAGYVVGWLAGSNVLRMTEAHRLGRPHTPESGPVRLPGPRTAPSAPTETAEALSAALRGAERFPFPAQRLPLDDDTEAQAWLDVGRCTRHSPGGGLTCIVHGPHTEHWYEHVYAPDAKSDADERIE